MNLNTFIVFSAVLITRICRARLIIEPSKPDKSSLVEAAVNSLKRCYIDRINIVGLAGVSAGDISNALSLREIVIPVILFEETSRLVNTEPVNLDTQYKLPAFMITVTDIGTLAKTFKEIKSSIWWNHMASFLLLDLSVSKHGCSNAFEVLWEAWNMNLLDSKFMCLHQTRGRLIYTYNPYTSKAPAPWQLENIYKGKNDHIWTLFVQVYRENEGICDTLDFDKTTDLGGYEIHASMEGSENWWYADPNRSPTIFNRMQNVSAQMLITSLNATWIFFKYPASDSRPVDAKGNPLRGKADVINGISDIDFNFQSLYISIKCTITYPHMASSIVAITQYRGYMSQLEKISSVLDGSSHIGLLLVCLVTLLFFNCILRQPPMPAILNLVRLLCNTGLLKIPNKLAPRIYLASLFILLVTIQGIYQGKLASLLTMESPLRNINTIDDLARSDHTIYGNAAYNFYFNESSFEGRFVGLNKYYCTNYVLRDSKAACVDVISKLLIEAAEFKLHMSQAIGMGIYGVYLIRLDWPLEKRVNKFYQTCVESYLIETQRRRALRRTLNMLEANENGYKEQTAEAIKLEDLIFAFVILGIGLGCGAIGFMIEIGFDRSRIVNALSRSWRRIRSIG